MSVEHACEPTKSAGFDRAHLVPDGLVYACPCGKTWSKTSRHYRNGTICGCGWEHINFDLHTR